MTGLRTLKTPEAALQPIPLAASSSKSTVMQPPPPRPLSFSSSSPGLSSEQEQFDPVAFFDSFVQDSLQLNSGKAKAREPQPSESEPSDSDIEMISNSRTPSPSKKRQASKKAAKASPHKTLAAASHFLQLAHQLLQAHEQQQQNEASPECCKALCKHLSEVAKHNAGKQIWTSSIADGSDKLTTSQLAKLIKILFSSVSPALKIQPIPAETLKAINNPTLATVKSNRGKKPTTKSKGSRAPTVASFGNNEDGPASPSKTGKSKRGRGRRASSSASMSAGSKSEDSEGEQQEESARSKKGKGKASTSQSGHWTLDQARQFEQDLETVFSASSASATILALLNVDKLPKKIYSEDIIDSCLHLIKTQLSSLIYPLAVCSAASADGRDSALNQAFDLSSTAQDSAEELLSLYPSILPRVTALLKVEDMPEAILIKAVYISIGPFFVDLQQQESTTSSRSRAKGKAKEVTSPGFVALKTIRLAAFALIRVVYARYSAQRQWIVEEILTSLTQMPDKKKKAYVLKNGKCIQTVSALLFHLVQSTAHHVVPKVRLKIERLQSDAGNSEDDPEALEDAKVSI